MTTDTDVKAHITSTIHRYLELVEAGNVDEILDLFAEGATIEDPVGSEVRVGSDRLRDLYINLGSLSPSVELISVRVCGSEAAFHFSITFDAGEGKMRLQPIDTMTFDGGGKITSMRAYFDPSDVVAV